MHPPALIIHGHFYQPPRENPWTGIVDREPSAAPFHDWNERIFRECYRPNAHARIVDEAGRVEDIVNNYAWMSFNFGPTLLSWMDRHHPDTLRAIAAADRASRHVHGGHGNAIAQGYNHVILPLATDRDLYTQLRWGLAEFRHRYGREAESLWLPETACDDRVLGACIDVGLRYVLLAPGQAARVKDGEGWRDVSDGSIDPGRPYKYLHKDGSGRSLALFFYDGSVSRPVAFEGALSSSQALVDRCLRASGGEGTVVHVVTDGESYGHHFKFGDRCLAYALTREAKRRGLWVTNYGELLDHHPAEIEVEVGGGEDGKGTSWSCAHGIGRWYRDCGCHTGGKPGWNQAWRTPLRAALDDLAARAAALYEERAGRYVSDPWALRDAYIELVLDRAADRGAFFARHAGRRLAADQQLELLRLLESQRSSMTMFTSCGWFFNDLSGIETVQVMRYAGRLLDQLAELGAGDLETRFLEGLAEAKSNLADKGSGADIYRAEVLPSRVEDAKVAVHISLSALPLELPPEGEIASRRYRILDARKQRRGRTTCATSRVELTQLATGARERFACCALFFGGSDLHCVLAPHRDDEAFARSAERIHGELESGSLLALLRVVQQELGPESFGLEHLLPSGREEVSRAIFEGLKDRYALQYEAMYQDARAAIALFDDAALPIPDELIRAAELALVYRFDEEIARAPRTRFEPAAYQRALEIAREAERFGARLPRRAACQHLEAHLRRIMNRVCAGDPQLDSVGAALELLSLAEQLGLALDRDRPQEQLHRALREGLTGGDELARLVEHLDLSPVLLG